VIDLTIPDVEDLRVKVKQLRAEAPFTSLRLGIGRGSEVAFYFDHTPEDAQAAQRFIDGLHETLSQIMATLEEKEPELVFGDEVEA
jgi:hypothetical protein